jgi:DNA-binding transcriptional LysR family regulator
VRFQDGFADLVKDGIDLAVRAGELRDSSLVARRIDAQGLVLVASPAYLRAHGTPARLEDLAGHQAIVFRMPTSGRNRPWQLSRAGASSSCIRRRARRSATPRRSARPPCSASGLCQLPDYVVEDELARGKLVEVLAAHRPPPMPLSAVVPSGRLMPPRVRVVLDALDALRERKR